MEMGFITWGGEIMENSNFRWLLRDLALVTDNLVPTDEFCPR